ncbi:hypothetical protein FJZ48_00170 [Candidatus Uhrbacteria bacterium]|nr:hypothetical protein [Candidatus Uhrbacteria bacterium]
MIRSIALLIAPVMAFGLLFVASPSMGLAATKAKKIAPRKVELTPVAATTKCLTPEIKQLYQTAKAKAEEEIQKAGAEADGAAKKYREDIETIWVAMHEPYCGYGSRGVRAVQNSFNKSVNKSKAKFAAAIKK